MLLPPLSVGASKLGDALNVIVAVLVSDLVILNKEASAIPAEIVTVADSETLIVAAVADVVMFSAAVNEAEEVKVGAVVSKATEELVTGDELLRFDDELRAHTR